MRLNFITKYYDAYDDYNGYADPNEIAAAKGSNIWKSVGSGAASGAGAGAVAGPWGAVIGGVVGAGVGLFSGEAQKKKAQKLLALNPRPGYNIPKEVQDNQQIAQNLSLTGTPSAQYNQSMRNIQRQTNSAIAGSQDRRSGLGLIGAVQQRQNDAVGNLDAQNAQARLGNIKTLMGANSQVAGYRDKSFDWNQKQKYQENYNYAMGLLGSGNQNIIHGIDTGVAGLMRSGIFGRGYGNSGYGSNSTRQPLFGTAQSGFADNNAPAYSPQGEPIIQ